MFYNFAISFPFFGWPILSGPSFPLTPFPSLLSPVYLPPYPLPSYFFLSVSPSPTPSPHSQVPPYLRSKVILTVRLNFAFLSFWTITFFFVYFQISNLCFHYYSWFFVRIHISLYWCYQSCVCWHSYPLIGTLDKKINQNNMAISQIRVYAKQIRPEPSNGRRGNYIAPLINGYL